MTFKAGISMTDFTPKYYLVRSSPSLIKKSIVGVGWSDFNFSEIGDAAKAISETDSAYGIRRWANQIRRFFAVREGDVVVAPLTRILLLLMATGWWIGLPKR
ncbi:hypothetical protein [Marinospirillum sp.]|uniref:hypothetical protein n=1 Tax=Marinospirillum sp. TaxID=2183934 RepID=UPI00384E8EB9